VVLVILAILAAIAIPALTGYVDKAKWSDIEQKVRTQKTAFQVLLNERYARDGTFTPHNQESCLPDDYFINVKSYAGGKGYDMYYLTAYGLGQYEKLTGDTSSLGTGGTPTAPLGHAVAVTDLNGSIKAYTYVRQNYFPPGERRYLYVLYMENINDLYAKRALLNLKSKMQTLKAK
jgi:type II secretory pathway pseudopilin PulG